jgi:hypothetical protein
MVFKKIITGTARWQLDITLLQVNHFWHLWASGLEMGRNLYIQFDHLCCAQNHYVNVRRIVSNRTKVTVKKK